MLEKNIVTTRPAATKDTNPSTGYAYNYSYLPPLAMVNVVPPAEGFSARPDWVFLVARSALKILINSIMIGVKNKGDNIEFAPQVIKDLKAVAQRLNGDAGRDLSNAIAMELEKQGSPTTPPQLTVLRESVIAPFANTPPLKTLLDIGQTLGEFGTVSGPASSLEDYNQLFQFISLPAVSQNFQEDSEFAAMRVAGPNPLIIERMKALDARIPITEDRKSVV